MSSLTGLFKSTPEESGGSDKLLDLYWNRAELKKEFAALRDEKFKLQDRIKVHEGATARVQQKMDHLENLLLDPDWVYSVVTFYQLRRLATKCHSKLSRFAEKIKQQREKRVHSKVLSSWDEKRLSEASDIEAKIGETRLTVQLLEDRLQSERHRHMTMNGFVRFFRGKRQARIVSDIEDQIGRGQAEENRLLGELSRNNDEVPPDHSGLSVSEKRSINFMIIAFTQQLYLHFVEDELAYLAKEASEKSVGAIRYGSKNDCDQILKIIDERFETMGMAAEFADELRQRAAKIAERALFRSDEDVVPVPASVAKVYSIGSTDVIRERDVNILGENYFGVAKVLSR